MQFDFAARSVLVTGGTSGSGLEAAGMIQRGDEHDPEVFAQVVDVNLTGTMPVAAAARPLLVRSRRAMVNVASMLSFPVARPLTQALQDDRDRSAAVRARTPMGRWGKPEDISGPVLFRCSPAAAFVTGVVLPVDGGYRVSCCCLGSAR